MTTTPAEQAAMRRALALAATPGVPLGPNPRVGCVLLAADGTTVAEGFHRGAGTAHAEADALARAGERARGTTAVVTLEPCAHTGRTGPCAVALREAGVRRVVFAQADPNPVAAGGAELLREAGIEVEQGLLVDEARALNRVWSFAVEHGRPFVTWKFATSLDGRSAAADGTSRWVSGPAARRDTHRLRALADTMLVGTGTVAVDDPALTVRDADDRPLEHQPLRAVMGLRDLDPGRRVLDAALSGGARASTCAPATPTRRCGSCASTTGSTCSSRAGPRWPRRSWAPAWSTRSSSTSPRCCSAPVWAPSATSESAPSPTRSALGVTDVTVLEDDNVRYTLTPPQQGDS